MGKATGLGGVGSVLACVTSGLVGAVIAEALDEPSMIPAVGGLVILSVVAVGLIPKNGLLRQQRLGRERWVRLLAIILIMSYPLTLVWSAGGTGLHALAPAMSLYLASSLLAWGSLRKNSELIDVVMYVGMIGAGIALVAAAIPSSPASGPIVYNRAVGGVLLTTVGAVLLTSAMSLAARLKVMSAVCAFVFCAGGVAYLGQEPIWGISILGLGAACLVLFVAAWAGSGKGCGVAILLVSVTCAYMLVNLITGDLPIAPGTSTPIVLGTVLLIISLSSGFAAVTFLLGSDISTWGVACSALAVLVLTGPLLGTGTQMLGVAGISFGTVLLVTALFEVVRPGLPKKILGWLRHDGRKDVNREQR